jgi:hypothetical protein
VSGSHVIEATYSGSSTFASSTGSVTVNVGGSGGGSNGGTFTLAATNVTVPKTALAPRRSLLPRRIHTRVR